MSAQTDALLTERELAERWQISVKTLYRWRVQGTGPAYVRLQETLAAPVRYRLEDVVQFEVTRLT